MPPNDRIFTSAETLDLLREKAKDADQFIIKVSRRPHMGAQPMVLATLSGATIEHFINPELWVPALVGGGKNISLQGFHAADPGKPVGGFVQFDIGDPPRESADTNAVFKPDWRGPPVLEFPKVGPKHQSESLPLYQSPPGPNSGNNATVASQTWERSPGGGFSRVDYGRANGHDDWRTGAAALEAERRSLEKERLEAERVKHRDELEALRKSHEADMRALKSELLGAIDRNARPTGPDPTQTLVAEMLKQAAEDRRAAAQQAAEDRRREAERQERSDARFNTMMEKLLTQPKENPLEMFKVVNELVATNSKKNDVIVEAQTKMMHTMTEMTGQQMGVAMDFISAAAEMHLGPQDNQPGWVKGLESVVKTVGAMAKGASARQIGPPPLPPPGQLHQGQQAQQPAPKKAPPVIDQVEQAIRQRYDVNKIASVLVEHFNDPSIQQAAMEAQGDFEGYLRKRLGNWVNEDAVNNPLYLKALFEAVEAAFTKAGLLAEEQPETEAEAEYEEEDGEPEPEDNNE